MTKSIKDARQGAGDVAAQVKQGAKAESRHIAQRINMSTAGKGAQVATTAAQTSKGSIKHGAKGSVKTASKAIRTANVTASKAIKTTQQSARAAKATAKATHVAARNAAYAAKAASRAAVAATKAAARGIAAFAKMAIAAAKSLVSAIAAGGWVAVAIILVILLVGMLATSAFGIFFTGGDMGDGNPTLREVVAEINQEHQDRIEEIKSSNPHDEVALSGSRTKWKGVLAVYSVKVSTDTDEPLDVITLDEKRQQLLRDIFWDMNTIESRVSEREVTEIVVEYDEEGNPYEAYETRVLRTLYITITGKTASEASNGYGFSESQTALLVELLGAGYDSAWQSVLYGIRSGSGDIVEVAETQLGNVGGAPYWSWYGFNSRVEWCACFVSWCANECGYIEAGVIPRHSYCQSGIAWFKEAGCWQDRASGYEPQPGDIVYFEWGDGGDADHVGIVEYVEVGRVHTIEGNSGDRCARQSYGLSSASIVGYGVPMY